MKQAKIGGMPSPSAPSGGNLRDWGTIAKHLEANPGVPVLMSGFRQTPKVEALQIQVNYSVPPKALRDLGGTVKAFIRNSSRTAEPGGRIGDLWLMWVPEGAETPEVPSE